MYSIETYTVDGVKTVYSEDKEVESVIQQLKNDFEGHEWYRIRKHLCRNDIQQPCEPWVIVAEKGLIPEDTL